MGKEQLTTRVEDVARQLPLLLQKVTAAGYSVLKSKCMLHRCTMCFCISPEINCETP
jgi:hypothetical protein